NRTSEHVDMKAMTDKIRTALIRSGKFQFADKDAREELAEEYEYQTSGFVNPETAKSRGNQASVDFIITGDLSSNVQQVGKDKVIYYKLNVNLVDVDKNIIAWADEREVRKKYKKRRISD
ncbi:MAG: penicillin-binding protein activator LpoB, partial [Bdellovibrionota bacterium]